jgi:predicted ribosome-associated RNA-binding protein Tma20
MHPDKPQHLYTVRYTLKREQITEFVNQLHEMQQGYIEAAVEAAVEASRYKQAIEVINYIKSL